MNKLTLFGGYTLLFIVILLVIRKSILNRNLKNGHLENGRIIAKDSVSKAIST